ncbi:LuxR C-terminal-related transcriptional regulator [Bradyrhizobium sp. CCBAU 25338]|jgi:two-component system nitrate/nitrite response regulator NarL|uniref:LuxR C-terminal-related transcriptional regulator n=1 Tax=Bradyrhizobium sp. CCBAU 25338 TaxID=1641877 RepID=UPI002304A9FD|nr:response regulator transcription factor [Bradyrhizobium sp. CCBAU 25338]MDA9528456.1 two-component response regulator [Bradyrhizobium sp. CCBAU 25338]
MRRIRIVIADRHPIVLQGISSLLSTQSDLAIVASCGNAASCSEAIRLLVPDVALVDAAMPNIGLPSLLALASTASQGTRVVLFADAAGVSELQSLVADGSCLVLAKETKPETLVATLRKVAQSQRLASLSASPGELGGESQAGEKKSLTQLTGRERQIMRLVSEGLSNKEIGRCLKITDGTIKVHLHHIFQKLDISNRTVLAALAISRNEVHLEAREVGAPGLLQRDPASAK